MNPVPDEKAEKRGGGLFYHKNQSCLKFPEMDRSDVERFSLILGGGGGGGFSAQFSGIIIFSLELYLGDQLCSKCAKKSFVSYSVNEI